MEQHWNHFQFTKKQQQAFLEDLCSLIDDGVTVSAAVDTIKQVSTGIAQVVASAISVAIAEGKLLADGMKLWFSPTVVEIVRAGETSGTLSVALRSAVESFQRSVDVLSVIINSMLYPIIVFLLSLLMTVIIKDTVLNNFMEIKPVTQWPSVGQTLFHIGSIVQVWWWFIIIVLILSGVGIYYLLQQSTGELRYRIDKIPLLSLYRSAVAARFMETLGMLINNGVVLKKALMVMHDGSCPYLMWHLVKMEYRLSGGKDNIADVLDTHLIHDHDLVRLRVVAKGKGFADALVSLGRRAYVRNAEVLKFTGKMLGVVLLTLSAMVAATIVLGIYAVGSAIAF